MKKMMSIILMVFILLFSVSAIAEERGVFGIMAGDEYADDRLVELTGSAPSRI